MKIFLLLLLGVLSVSLMACAPVVPFKQSDQHIKQTAKPAGKPLDIIQMAPLPAPPSVNKSADVFTVVVNDVPVKELIFAIARDANVEIDVNGKIDGQVTLNAIDQTFEEILDRVSLQTGIRYRVRNNVYLVEVDVPYIKHYDISYVNMERISQSTIAISTEVASTGGTGGDSTLGNISSTNISNNSAHRFWATLTRNINNMLSDASTTDIEEEGAQVVEPTEATGLDESAETIEEDAVIVSRSRAIASPESSMISVMATQSQHRMVEEYLELALNGVKRQVFIEATIIVWP